VSSAALNEEIPVEIWLKLPAFRAFLSVRGCIISAHRPQFEWKLYPWSFSAILLYSDQEGSYFMAINDSSSNEPRATAIEKKPYEKPRFRYEQAFVTSALSCGKTGTEGQCALQPTKLS
jgi:hypothetical protein